MAGQDQDHDADDRAADTPVEAEAGAANDAPAADPKANAVGVRERKPDAPRPRDLGGVRKPAPARAEEPPAPEPEPDDAEPAAPVGVNLTPEQYDRLRQAEKDRDALLEAEKRRKEEARKAEEERLKEQGEYKTLLSTRDAELADLKRELTENSTRTRAYVRDRELAVALSDKKLVPGGADQLRRLWEDEFETVEDDAGSWRVQTRDGKSVGEFVRDKLASKQYAHFVLAEARGGSGSQNTAARPAPEPPRPTGEKMYDSLRASYNNRHHAAAAPLAGRNRMVPNSYGRDD